MTITGRSAIYFMLADPIDHVRSPGMFSELFAANGIDAVMVPINYGLDDIEAAWESFRCMKNLKGLIVSVPFKALAHELSDEACDRAQRMGTANAVRRQADGRFLCENFDGAGFVAAMAENGHRIEDRKVLIVGTGGAGASIAFCVAEAGAAALSLYDIEPDRARRVAEGVRRAFSSCRVTVGGPDPVGHDIVVNATPVGMHPDDPLPLDVARLSADMVVVDIIMQPRETALLRRARDVGCMVQFGQDMMDAQMALLADFLCVHG